MKTTTCALAAVSLLRLTSAQPFRVGHHAHQHVKKDTVTVVDIVYEDTPEVVVYVDTDGNPLFTSTEIASGFSTFISSSTSSTSSASAPTPALASASAVQGAVAPVVSVAAVQNVDVSSTPVASMTPAAPSSTTAATYAVSKVSSAASTSSSASPSSSSEGSGFGFSYSPYNADGSCKTQSQVTTDFNAIPSGYSLVRVYGTDCSQVTTVLTAAKAKGLKLFAGVYSLSTLISEIALIVSAAAGDWSNFDTVSIGNELVNGGTNSASEVVAAIASARELLTAAGYVGKVVTVDTLVASRANPSLCDSSDYCAVNSHPFFDGGVVAVDSGNFLTAQIATLKAVLSDQTQEIVITETGWPSQGQTNGKAVPSSANQASAISSIRTAFTSSPASVILFTAFNDMWKASTVAQFQAEKYWGFLGTCPSG